MTTSRQTGYENSEEQRRCDKKIEAPDEVCAKAAVQLHMSVCA